MLMPPVLSSRLPTGTVFAAAHDGRCRRIAGNTLTPPAAAAVRRKSRRFGRCLAIVSPVRLPEFEGEVTALRLEGRCTARRAWSDQYEAFARGVKRELRRLRRDPAPVRLTSRAARRYLFGRRARLHRRRR